MTLHRHRYFIVVLASLFAACGSNPTAPSSPSLAFTITPNPVPTSGTSTACVGTPAKSWFWTVDIRNTGTATFTAASFTNTVVIPGVPSVISQGTANDFLGLFGSTTIAPNASVQGRACIGLVTPPIGTVTSTTVLRGQSGESFTTPVVQLLQ